MSHRQKRQRPVIRTGRQEANTISSVDDITLVAQRTRLLAYLRHSSIDTLDCVRNLNILRPGARISELRKSGHNIVTRLIDVRDDQGRQHRRVALYSLMPKEAR